MTDRIELIYRSLDEMGEMILRNRIPTAFPQLDPNRPFEPCTWPETFLAWKKKVLDAQDHFGARPLTDVQWWTIESYMVNQYGFDPIQPDGGEG